ncbi:hypothetical protein PVK06_020007 [Gossypium arboreum]|uniref:Coatomer subunit zeta n=1 Tax=Gossypium arboreum TaxID=29729 RepID=A0ABR0PLA6_GOSAR|nr:hypothetical protein PVK06_020007 [Gossypium arboreum]
MLLAILFSNFAGHIILKRYLQMCLYVRSMEFHLRKDYTGELSWLNWELIISRVQEMKSALFVSSQKSVYIVYTVLGGVRIYIVGKDEYDELALTEVMFVITSSIKDACGKSPSERLFLDKYGKICLCLDEIHSPETEPFGCDDYNARDSAWMPPELGSSLIRSGNLR